MVAALLVEWSSPLYLVLNVLASLLWVAGIVDLVRSPRGGWFTRRGAVLMVLVVVLPSLFIAGTFIPIGAIGWFGWWRHHGGLGRVAQRAGAPGGSG